MGEAVQVVSLGADFHTGPGCVLSKKVHLVVSRVDPWRTDSQATSEGIVGEFVGVVRAGGQAPAGLQMGIVGWGGRTHGNTLPGDVISKEVIGAGQGANASIAISIEVRQAGADSNTLFGRRVLE